MVVRIGINGFGRIGRLAMRAGFTHPDLEFVAINEPHADAATMALLLEFDSVQGRWGHACAASDRGITVDDHELAYTMHS
ncbi:MAG: glyceraldehyde 3-phosphate dehydrogenase, partial [Planctomycetota bacterium]